MEKIISVNLAGRVLPIEEDAYLLLNHYFESLRAYFAATESADEIVGDIESRVSEMLSDYLHAGAPAVNVLHVSQVKARMGSVEDFRAADGGEPENSTGQTGNVPPPAGILRDRFARNSGDKMLGGLCSGIAAYFHIDPALVRVLFAVLTLGGWGVGILIYLALWAFTPEEVLPAGLTGRRLYRDPSSRWGGVCAGLGAYFGKDPWIFRIVFLIPLITVISSSGSGWGWGVLTGSLSFSLVVIYFLLWALLPEAKTRFQKEEMHGENLDIHRIREQVKFRTARFGEEVKTATQRFTAQTKERFPAGNRQGATAARQGAPVLGKIFRSFVLFTGALLAFSLLLLLLGYFFGGVSDLVNGFLLQTPRQRLLVNSSLLLLLGAPFLSLLLKLIASALRLPASRFAGLTFSLLWVAGIAIGVVAWADALKNYRSFEKVVTEVPLSQPTGKVLTVAVPGPGIVYENALPVLNGDLHGWNVDHQTLSLSNLRIDTEASPDSLFHVFVTRQSRGRSRAQARQLAEGIAYPVSGSGGQLNLPAGYTVTRQQGFRGQQVKLRIQVPAGGNLQFAPSVHQKLIVEGEDRYDALLPAGGRIRYNRYSAEEKEDSSYETDAGEDFEGTGK